VSRLFRSRGEDRAAPAGGVEERAISSIPWNVGGPLSSGTVSQDRALHMGPVFAAVRHITDYGSTLPLKSYRRISEDERAAITLPKLFSDLRTDERLVAWLSQALASLVVRGNAVGYKVATDGFGYPTSITWVSMDRVHVDDNSGVGRWYIDGREVSRSELVHIPWVCVPGRTLGLSPIEYYAATINAGLESQSYGNDWFGHGGFPPAVFQNTQKTVSPEQSASIRARLSASMRSREPLVTGNDWTFTPVNIPPDQAQFIETQKLSANQVAAIYGIDPTEIGGTAPNSLTYSTEETRQINRAANMRPYLHRFEEAFASWLPLRQFVKFNTDATIRIDTKTRHEVFEIQRRIGLRSLNEQRVIEDLPPIPGGDVYVPAPVQQQPAEGARPLLSVVNKERDAHYE
jgi:HK97 family phage portal protein